MCITCLSDVTEKLNLISPDPDQMAQRFGPSVVQDNTQDGIVDLDLAVVLDEAQFPEFVHE